MYWIALHLPALALEAFQATLGAGAGARPLALQERLRLVAVNDAARDKGLVPGMKRATALALAPDLVLGQPDAQREASALQAVAHVLLGFTPSVAWAAPDGVLAEVAASLRYFGGLSRLLRQLRADLHPLGLTVRIASAPTALGARCLARALTRTEPGGDSPGAWTVADLPALHAALAPLPAALLLADPPRQRAAQQMGLHTLGDLKAQPRAGLARRFGDALPADLDYAWGDAPEVHAWVLAAPRFANQIDLCTRADQVEPLQAGANLLLAELIAWARARQARVARFTLALHHERRLHAGGDAGPSLLDVALAEPSADARHLHSLLRERLGRLVLKAPVVRLSLACDDLAATATAGDELFPSARSQQEGLLRLIERLQARLGDDHVQRPTLRADHRPERAQDGGPTVSAPPAGRRTTPAANRSWTSIGGKDEGTPRQTRPVWLLPVPRPLPERRSQPWLDGQPLRLLSGPERIESGWWDAGLAARDYFIAQAPGGALVWIFRHRGLPDAVAAAGDLPVAVPGGSAGWFLHGRFG